MKKSNILSLVSSFAMPATLVALGVILLLNPDAATVAVTRLIGGVLTAVGAGFGLCALFTWPVRRVSRLTAAVICLAAGGYLLLNPLFLAANISRFLGILLALEGIQNLGNSSKPMAFVTLALAAVMILMPMAASRLVFILCSIVLIGIGVAQLLDRIKGIRLLREGDDPNIIDAL